ncbi:hypothetical protein ACHAW5_010621 [Stephanodiscus triporus]|uniref:Uncharacterized protein n=1 Tax=Stephanodiscus triporus TaxID=2934178 RepID=A0ABD3P3K7_9STRA
MRVLPLQPTLVKFVPSSDTTCCNPADSLCISHEKDRTTDTDDDNTSDDSFPNDGNSEEYIVSPSSQPVGLCQPRRSSLRSADRRRDSTRSVGFSTVQTRLFEVIDVDDKPKPDGLNVARPQVSNAVEKKSILDDSDNRLETLCYSRNLGWRYSDRVSDIEAHQTELEEKKKSEYTRMIRDHIERVEREKKERELRHRQRYEKKGFKSKVLKPLLKGFIEASSRSAFIISPYNSN